MQAVGASTQQELKLPKLGIQCTLRIQHYRTRVVNTGLPLQCTRAVHAYPFKHQTRSTTIYHSACTTLSPHASAKGPSPILNPQPSILHYGVLAQAPTRSSSPTCTALSPHASATGPTTTKMAPRCLSSMTSAMAAMMSDPFW